MKMVKSGEIVLVNAGEKKTLAKRKKSADEGASEDDESGPNEFSDQLQDAAPFTL
jgi:hypothetical protein